ncbi:hypothetical protein SCHPADRAFT_795664, partial [Schizopora paradoxa]
DNATAELLQAVHDLLVSLLMMDIRPLQESKWNDPLQCFLAAYALREDKSFMQAHHITQPLAKCKYFIRSVVFWQANLIVDDFNGSFQDASEQICLHFLNHEKLSAYYNVCSISSYATSLVLTQPLIPNTTWNPALDVVKIDGKLLPLSTFRHGCKDLMVAIGDALQAVKMGHNIPITNLLEVGDNLSNMELGYSYLGLQKYTEEHALLKAFTTDKDSSLFYIDPDGKLCLSRRKAHEWMLKASNLNLLLGFGIHLTSGQPPRSPELCDIRTRNGERRRGIMKDHKKTFMVTLQCKAGNI